MQYFEPSTSKLLGTVDLSTGAMVRLLGEQSGRDFQIRDATEKVFFLQAENVETRDTWAHHVMRVLTGSSGQPTGLGESVNFSGDAMAQVDVVVPVAFKGKTEGGGGDLTLKLTDGRSLRVAVPAGTGAGAVLRAAGPLNSLRREDPRAIVASVDDALNKTHVPIVVPCCKTHQDDWGHALELAVGGTPSAGESAGSGAAGSSGSGPGDWSERYDVEPSEGDSGDMQKKKISTGLYDMAMLTRLGKMEETFRGELAAVWGEEDEDDLPDTLQELDFNDILASGDTEAVRTAWLLIRLTGAEGYDAASMKATVSALVENTIRSIQALENEYVKS
jgi:hypothetical protein